MKKITILSLILLGFGFSFLLVKADIITPGYRYVGRCVKIINLDQFPEISLIGRITGPGVSNDTSGNIIEIKNNECISKGYKFNSINIYWNDKDKSSIIDENKLLIENFDVDTKYIKEKDPLIKEEVEYSLIQASFGKYRLEKTKEISYYNNGKPAKIETFSNPDNSKIIKEDKKETEPLVKNDVGQEKKNLFEDDNIVNPQRDIIKKSFWQKVKCFFSSSKNCK